MFLLHLTGWISVVLNFPLLVAIKVPIMRYYPPLRRGETQWLILLCKSEAGTGREGGGIWCNKKWWPPLSRCLLTAWLPVKGWDSQPPQRERERDECPLPARARVLSVDWSTQVSGETTGQQTAQTSEHSHHHHHDNQRLQRGTVVTLTIRYPDISTLWSRSEWDNSISTLSQPSWPACWMLVVSCSLISVWFLLIIKN